MATDNNDFTHEFQIYSTDLNAGTMGTGKFLLFDNNINAVKVENIDNIKIGGGSNGKVLATDGEGNLRWVSAGSGGGARHNNDGTGTTDTIGSANYYYYDVQSQAQSAEWVAAQYENLRGPYGI